MPESPAPQKTVSAAIYGVVFELQRKLRVIMKVNNKNKDKDRIRVKK